MMNKFLKAIADFLEEIFKKQTAGVEPDFVEIKKMPYFGDSGSQVRYLQDALNRNGASLVVDGDFGPKTKLALSVFQKSKKSVGTGRVGPKTLKWLKLKLDLEKKVNVEENIHIPGKPIYPSKHRFHPRFDSQLPEPYTHLHPFDITLSVVGQKEIKGKKHNPFIAHLHEHAGNLGTHSEGADYSDEVPHCSSGLNWAADMGGCEKSNNALASSWSDRRRKSYNPRKGTKIFKGDIIHKRTGKRNHVTICDKDFNLSDKYFTGTGFNQADSIKSSSYRVRDIVSVQMWKPKKGTVLAPIGILGHKPVPSTGEVGESTR